MLDFQLQCVVFVNSVQWIENEIYGKYLMGAFRFDVKQADKNAGFFVTFEDAAEPSGGDLGA